MRIVEGAIGSTTINGKGAHAMNRFLLKLSVGATLLSPAYAGNEDAGAVKYLDHLKTCTPFTLQYPHPIVPGFTAQNIIKEKVAGNCLVTFVMPGDKKLNCRFTSETIKLLTTEAKYAEARQNRYVGSTSDAVSQRMAEECKLD
ncbi:MAG TPA: hypothetical protein VGO37_18830 [Steroidobacteraceae bacterium]|jgi:hypothetical protein|nr:hypothetical protein [Steroidobacteraceae bacterium]